MQIGSVVIEKLPGVDQDQQEGQSPHGIASTEDCSQGSGGRTKNDRAIGNKREDGRQGASRRIITVASGLCEPKNKESKPAAWLSPGRPLDASEVDGRRVRLARVVDVSEEVASEDWREAADSARPIQKRQRHCSTS